mmetsp:Transcript_76269/g.182512  ORF Transcript_76269/g.182512 Transcript_76269/m.182512 type:complete len:430 (+) Transcript_76269:547-1836(+)
MFPGNLTQTICQWTRELSWSTDGSRGQCGHEVQDLFGRGLWCSHFGFKVPQQCLALVDAAHRVDGGGCHAVGLGVHVVGDQNSQVGRVRLIQSAKLAEVGHALGELPIPLERCAVEVLQEDSASAGVLMLGQQALQVAALGVLPAPIALTDLLHDLRGRAEGEVAHGEVRLRHLGLRHAGHDLHGELLGVLPARVAVHNVRALLSHRGGVRVLGTHQEDGHVGVDELLEGHLVHALLLGGAVGLIDHPKPGHRLVVDEMLQGGRQHGELMEPQPLALQAVLKEREHEGWDVILQHLRSGHVVPAHARGLEALDVHGMALDKEPVQDIPRCSIFQVAVGILGHGLKGGLQGTLDGFETLLGDTVATAKGRHHLLQYRLTELVRAHGSHVRVEVSSKRGFCTTKRDNGEEEMESHLAGHGIGLKRTGLNSG